MIDILALTLVLRNLVMTQESQEKRPRPSLVELNELHGLGSARVAILRAYEVPVPRNAMSDGTLFRFSHYPVLRHSVPTVVLGTLR
ncbi:hypothetical protein C8J57DRAFT_597558 [Mycena rebaudengoi]|nr:hypothetical protein C8J57DRAFT_597558 [Mycena rebaudengoi]